MPIKKTEVILEAITSLEKGTLRVSKHALIRMKERRIVLSEIKEVIYNSVRETIKDQLTDDGTDWKYAIRGLNEAKDKDIRIIVLFEGQYILVVTAIVKNLEEKNG